MLNITATEPAIIVIISDGSNIFFMVLSLSQKYPTEKSPTNPIRVYKLIKLPICIGSNPLYCKNGINIPPIVADPKNKKK